MQEVPIAMVFYCSSCLFRLCPQPLLTLRSGLPEISRVAVWLVGIRDAESVFYSLLPTPFAEGKKAPMQMKLTTAGSFSNLHLKKRKWHGWKGPTFTLFGFMCASSRVGITPVIMHWLGALLQIVLLEL